MAHEHSIYDCDTHFVIDPVTREIKNESEKTAIVQNDHNSERFSFELPKTIEGHDMLLCNVVQVHYVNTDSKTKEAHEGLYAVDDLQISPGGDDVVILSWLLSQEASKAIGTLYFGIVFKCINDDGTLGYAWHTAINKDFKVVESLDNSDIIVEENPDILAQLEARLAAVEQNGGGTLPIEPTLTNSCTFLDAYVAWCNGEKFPIAFYGDSTFYGDNTSGAGYTFCDKLQALLREECGNNATVYKVAKSGENLDYAINQFDHFFSSTGTYSDTKMLGIGFGINDRLRYSTFKDYKNGVYAKVETLINKCFENNIQPFLITSQAMNECGVQTNYISQYPLRDNNAMNVCANGAKKELAEKYNIPLIDLNKFTELYLMYSTKPANEIVSDRAHFGNIGHQYEAGFFFSNIVSRTIMIEKTDRYVISYSNQNLKSCIPEDKISYGTGDFKIYADYIKSNTTDTKIMDAYIFVVDRPPTLKAVKNIGGSTYVKIDGSIKTLSSTEVNLGLLDLGLHHLEVYTGLDSHVNFKGFIVNENVIIEDDDATGGDNEEITENLIHEVTDINDTQLLLLTDTVVPCLLAFNFDENNKTTALSGYTVTKISMRFGKTGNFTIGKVDLNEYGTGTMTVLFPNTYTVNSTGGMQTITLADSGLVLGENEGLVVCATSDQARIYFATEYSSTSGKIIGSAAFKDASVQRVGVNCKVYGYKTPTE